MGQTVETECPADTTGGHPDVATGNRRAALDAAQAEDRAYYHRRMALMRAARFRAGLILGVIYGLLLAATYTAFGMWAASQQDRWTRGLLGLAMYVLGFCWVPLTLGAVRLYHRLWLHHARHLGLGADESTKASPHANGVRPDDSRRE